MSMVGYEEVPATAVPAEIADDLAVPITSLAELTVVKRFARQDRHAGTTKDARDLAMLFRHYHISGNQDRIFGEEMPLMEVVDRNLGLASPRLLGKDFRRLASAATLQQLQALLNNEKMTDRPITHMSAVFSGTEDSIAAATGLLAQFKAGVSVQGKRLEQQILRYQPRS